MLIDAKTYSKRENSNETFLTYFQPLCSSSTQVSSSYAPWKLIWDQSGDFWKSSRVFSFHKSKDRDNAGVRSDEIYAGAKNSLVELA